jgi:hypothetical protein
MNPARDFSSQSGTQGFAVGRCIKCRFENSVCIRNGRHINDPSSATAATRRVD